MESLPHSYNVTATGSKQGTIDLTSQGLTTIASAAPAQFGGPGDKWSPETLLVAAVADCFILTFKAISRASKLDWESISCQVEGTLDRINDITQFSEFKLHVVLDVPSGVDEKKAVRLLEKSEHSCLITNSLSAKTHLDIQVRSTH